MSSTEEQCILKIILSTGSVYRPGAKITAFSQGKLGWRLACLLSANTNFLYKKRQTVIAHGHNPRPERSTFVTPCLGFLRSYISFINNFPSILKEGREDEWEELLKQPLSPMSQQQPVNYEQARKAYLTVSGRHPLVMNVIIDQCWLIVVAVQCCRDQQDNPTFRIFLQFIAILFL